MKLIREVFFTISTNLIRRYYDEDNIYTDARRWVIWSTPKISHSIEPIDSIQEFCVQICKELQEERYIDDDKKTYIDKKTYDIQFLRNVRIRNVDDETPSQSHDFNGGSFNFILSTTGKLIYLSDILSILKNSHCFQGTPLNISEKKGTPMYIEKYDKHNVQFRALTAQDTVVDKHLNQIWPIATQQPPIALFKLLKKTTEKIW